MERSEPDPRTLAEVRRQLERWWLDWAVTDGGPGTAHLPADRAGSAMEDLVGRVSRLMAERTSAPASAPPDEGPVVRCDRCGRRSTSEGHGRACGATLPDGRRCEGMFHR